MAVPFKDHLVRLRDRLPLPAQRLIHRFAFHCLLPRSERTLWDDRLDAALRCTDNAHLPRHPDAGKVRRGVLTMHNGIKIHAGSYYGWGSHRVLVRNRGCHEPQEERAFAQVLEHLPAGACMIELGAYWAFYSAWFASKIPHARNLLIEPEPGNLIKGRQNFELNGLTGTFIHALVGAEHRPHDAPPTVSVEGLAAEHDLPQIHLLHSDIQGHEMTMLHGAGQLFDQRSVHYVFISTHSNQLHQDCLLWLTAKGYLIQQDIDLDATFSHDGLIVAQSPDLPPLPNLVLDRSHH